MAKSRTQVDTILVTFLAKGATVPKAAHEAGVSERTVYRRLKRPEFQARIDVIQQETLERTAAILTKAAEEAVRSSRGQRPWR
jgi:transposase